MSDFERKRDETEAWKTAEPYTPTTDDVREDYVYDDHLHPGARAAFDRWFQAELRKARVEALREAAEYAAAGVHCADMGVAPPSMIRWLRARADRIQEDQ